MQQIQQKRKIFLHCWRGQPVSALKAVMNNQSFSEIVIWSPWFIPGCSTEHIQAAELIRGLDIWGFILLQSRSCLSFSICKIIQASSWNVLWDPFYKKLQWGLRRYLTAPRKHWGVELMSSWKCNTNFCAADVPPEKRLCLSWERWYFY